MTAIGGDSPVGVIRLHRRTIDVPRRLSHGHHLAERAGEEGLRAGPDRRVFQRLQDLQAPACGCARGRGVRARAGAGPGLQTLASSHLRGWEESGRPKLPTCGPSKPLSQSQPSLPRRHLSSGPQSCLSSTQTPASPRDQHVPLLALESLWSWRTANTPCTPPEPRAPGLLPTAKWVAPSLRWEGPAPGEPCPLCCSLPQPCQQHQGLRASAPLQRGRPSLLQEGLGD